MGKHCRRKRGCRSGTGIVAKTRRLLRRCCAPLFLTGFVSLSLLAACEDAGPIKVGFLGSLTGRASEVSQASWNAVQLAVAEVNEAGGINGRPVELVHRDNMASPETAGQNVLALASEGVAAIIGPNLSSVATGMMAPIEETETVTVSPTVSSMAFVGKDDFFFRMNSTTRQNTAAYATHLIDNGERRVALLHDLRNAAFSQSWTSEFIKAFEGMGGEIVAAEPFDPYSTVRYSDAVAPLIALDADAIILVGHGVDAALLSQQIRKTGSGVRIFASQSASTRLIELGGKAVEGLTLLQSYDRYSADPRFSRFREAYEQRFKTSPGYSSIAAYDAATVLFSAMKKAGDAISLKRELLVQGKIQGLQQDLEFDSFGDGSRKAVFVTVRDGKFVAE